MSASFQSNNSENSTTGGGSSSHLNISTTEELWD